MSVGPESSVLILSRCASTTKQRIHVQAGCRPVHLRVPFACCSSASSHSATGRPACQGSVSLGGGGLAVYSQNSDLRRLGRLGAVRASSQVRCSHGTVYEECSSGTIPPSPQVVEPPLSGRCKQQMVCPAMGIDRRRAEKHRELRAFSGFLEREVHIPDAAMEQ